jgi:hypothetical protein
VKFFEKLIETVPALLLLIGTMLFLLGVAGGVRHKDVQLPIDGLVRQFATSLAGAAVFVLGLWAWARQSAQRITPEEFGITIISPQRGDVVHTVDVRGTLKKKIPAGYKLRVIRVYPDGRIYPLREATIDPGGATWEARSCDIGGDPGDDRSLAACLCGPGAESVFAYLDDAIPVHNGTIKDLVEAYTKFAATLPSVRPLPPIRQKPPDLVECYRVPLKRAARKP